MKAPESSVWDLVAVGAYFFIVLCVGFYAMYKSNRGTLTGYFLAGRFMTWLPIGASLFASNIGSEHFVGLAGSGAASGIGVGAFELNALVILQLLGWVFLPVYIASGVQTLPDFMRKRFGRQRIRTYLACLSLGLYVLTKISVNMYSGSLFVQRMLGWNTYLGIVLVLALTAVCTVTGGLTAVIYTDTLQCFLMVFGATGLAGYSLYVVGGYSALMERYMTAVPNETLPIDLQHCARPSNHSFTMLRGPADPDMPWPGFILGQSPASIWYWAADQMIVQRVLAARSLSHAQGATIFAGYLKILPLFIIVFPGMISRVLFTDEIACVTTCEAQCGNPASCSNLAYPNLVVQLLPSGARGIMLAVMLAALMSDLTSIFNSSSTLFTCDLYRLFRPRAAERELLIVGRLFVLVMVAVSIAWVPIVMSMQGGQLYIYIQSIAANLAPPVAAVYLLAILWRRTNETGAFTGLMAGLAGGVIRLVLDFLYRAPSCIEHDLRPAAVRLHYMYVALILFAFTLLVTVVVSLVTKPVEEWRLVRTTYWTRLDRSVRPDEDAKTRPLMKDGHAAVYSTSSETDTDGEVQLKQLHETPARSRNQPTTGNQSCLGKACSWFCGLQSQVAGVEEKHATEITLEQTKREKRILSVNLCLILTIVIALYLIFSIYTPMQAAKYLES